MLQDPGDERFTHFRQLQRIISAVERVDITLEQAHVGVHRRARVLAEWLGHERRPGALFQRDFFDDVAEGHHVVSHRQSVGKPQVDLLLAGCAFVMAELHRDAHEFQGIDRVAAKVQGGVVHRLVEIAGVVDRDGHRPVLGSGLEQEELDFGMHVAGEAEFAGLRQLPPQHVPRVRPRRRAVRHGDVAKHPR
ncbi:Uncharacterised protein [Mycobacterium tuberculosis]|nr:Uncharacterised protein [Mycobacterium tuberculosis]CKR34079.1 Uncharacterised protein [Mycobacterium tuberculosis]CKS49947.1 Uncharacterised protein [Mycobacterium tuberculosis]CKS84033.1 Uncharacterised protein [Mycobacterium tuberculosis]CKU63211.1 Uncharacterised protein [Mycobacterium tuberculosis]